ncbi:MAG: hypothetical protein KJ915_06035 [Candidatus Omnitrophica bacterium]|nr:hypothetical protein [Candidatus Omnitrophota bacterium]
MNNKKTIIFMLCILAYGIKFSNSQILDPYDIKKVAFSAKEKNESEQLRSDENFERTYKAENKAKEFIDIYGDKKQFNFWGKLFSHYPPLHFDGSDELVELIELDQSISKNAIDALNQKDFAKFAALFDNNLLKSSKIEAVAKEFAETYGIIKQFKFLKATFFYYDATTSMHFVFFYEISTSKLNKNILQFSMHKKGTELKLLGFGIVSKTITVKNN